LCTQKTHKNRLQIVSLKQSQNLQVSIVSINKIQANIIKLYKVKWRPYHKHFNHVFQILLLICLNSWLRDFYGFSFRQECIKFSYNSISNIKEGGWEWFGIIYIVDVVDSFGDKHLIRLGKKKIWKWVDFFSL
jgi:hypothetical protein